MDIKANSILGSFELEKLYMGEFGEESINGGHFKDIIITGYANNEKVFSTSPYTESDKNHIVDNFSIDYSAAKGKLIDSFRITYTKVKDDYSQHAGFNLINFTIANSSINPPISNAQAPNISTQPIDHAVNIGELVTLAVTATSNKGSLSYQWYENTTNSSTGGTLIADATHATYSASTNTPGTMYYYVVVTNTDNNATGNQTATATSQVAAVTVSAKEDRINPTPGGNGEITITMNNADSVTLGWSKATDNETSQSDLEYRVYLSTSSNLNTISEVESGTQLGNGFTKDLNSLTVTDLLPNTTYYFNVLVKDEAGNKSIYLRQQITTQNLKSSNADLSSLSLNPYLINEVFDPNTVNYTATVPYGTREITVDAIAADSKATVHIVEASNEKVALDREGTTDIHIEVTAEDGTVKTYKIVVTEAQLSDNADLSDLTILPGQLSTDFEKNTLNYTACVPSSTTGIMVTPSLVDSKAIVKLKINNEPVIPPQQIELNEGKNVIDIIVTAEDQSTTKTYTVTVYRLRPAPIVTADDNINSIIGIDNSMEYQINGGTWTPYNLANFPDLSGDKTVKVRYLGNSVPASEEATLTFTTNPQKASAPNITEASTAEDMLSDSGLVIRPAATEIWDVTHYKISEITGGTLYKNDGTFPIRNGDFIAKAEGELGLKFRPNSDANTLAGDSFSFQVQAALGAAGEGLSNAATASITVTEVNDEPIAADDQLSDKVMTSEGIEIPFGDLLRNDQAGPDNEKDQTLTIISVSEEVGGTAIIQDGKIIFKPNRAGAASFNYTVRDNGKTDGVVDPKTASATVQFNVIPNPVNVISRPVIHLVGNDSIYIELGSQYVESGYSATDEIDGDLTDKVTVNGRVDHNQVGTYTLKYNVKNSNDVSAAEITRVVHVVSANLEALSVSSGDLAPSFDPTQLNYHLTIPSNTMSIDISASTFDKKATATLNGEVIGNSENWPITLQPGDSTLAIIVTAQGEITKTYKLEITRELTHTELPAILNQPVDLTVNVGEVADLSVNATAAKGELSYQWYFNTTNSNSGGVLLPGATSATYAAPTGVAGTTYYYVKVTNTDHSATGNQTAEATSEVAAVTVNTLTNAAVPAITAQPENKTVSVGGVADLTVEATSAKGELSYQWYSNKTNSNSGGVLIPGATSATYAAPTGVAGTTYYYVKVTNTDHSATGNQTAMTMSEVATVTVNALTHAATPTITVQPENKTVSVAGRADLTVSATSAKGKLSYQWYSNTTNSNSGGTLISGATNATYAAPTEVAGTTYYYVKVTNTDHSATGNQTATTTSQTGAVTVNNLIHAAVPAITAQPENKKASVGGVADLTVAATSAKGELSYQWYSNKTNSNSGGILIPGATSATYAAPTGVAGTTYYYVKVTNTDHSATGNQTATTTSEVAAVTIKAKSTNAYLGDLTLSSGLLSPAFTKNRETYTVDVPNSVTSITFTPIMEDIGKATATVNGQSSITAISLTVGANVIQVVVTAEDGVMKNTYTITVNRAQPSSSSGGDSSTSAPQPDPTPTPQTTTEQVVVDVDGNNGSNLTKTPITRTTEPNGTVKDKVAMTDAIAKETVQKAKEQGVDTARIIIPDKEDKVAEVLVEVPKSAVDELNNGNLQLEIVTPNAVVSIPTKSLTNFTGNLYFRVVPIKSESEKQQVVDRAKNESLIQEAIGNNTVQVIGRPMEIETNMQSREVTIVLPLTASLPINAVEREKLLNNLGVYIEHTDGSKELLKGVVVKMQDGSEGLQFTVNKFSTFTMVYLEGWEDETADETIHIPYIKGYGNSEFRPEASVTRAQMATMLARNIDTSPSTEVYADVSPKHEAYEAIMEAKGARIMMGKNASIFDPNGTVTRAQMAAIVYRWVQKQCKQDATSYAGCAILKDIPAAVFKDVKDNHWAKEAINFTKATGIMVGESKGQFRPEENLTRAQAVKVLNRLFKRGPLTENTTPTFKDVPATHWAFSEIEEAAREHLSSLDIKD